MITAELQPTSPTPRVLIVDDDPVTCATLAGYFAEDGYAVAEAGDAAQARDTMARQGVDLVLLDVGLPVEEGYSLTREIRLH